MNKIISPNAPQGNQPDQQEQMAELARMIRSAEDVTCDECGGSSFINVYKIRKISGLLTGTGKDMVVPVPIYACADCGHVNERFLKSVGLDRDPKTADANKQTDTKIQV